MRLIDSRDLHATWTTKCPETKEDYSDRIYYYLARNALPSCMATTYYNPNTDQQPVENAPPLS